MPRLPEYGQALSYDPDNDVFYMVDVSDSTDHASGSSKKATFDTLDRYKIPTAQDLSGGTKLQDYIDAQYLKTHRYGPIYLPKGDIVIEDSLVISKKSGVTICGAGVPVNSTETTNGWDDNTSKHYTRIIFNGTNTKPVVEFDGFLHGEISNLAFVHGAGGHVARLSQATGGFVAGHLVFDRVMFAGGGGFMAASGVFCDDLDGDILNSDLTFRDCRFHKLEKGLWTDGNQAVNHVFCGLNFWYNNTTCIYCEKGGNVFVHGGSMIDSDTFLKVVSGGTNVTPFVISGLRIDRVNESYPLPIIVDLASQNCSAQVSVDGVGVRRNAALDTYPSSHIFFKLHSSYASFNSEINIGTTNLKAISGPTYYHRIGVYNNSNVLIGYFDADGNYNPV